MTRGQLVAIFVGAAREPLRPLSQVEAVAGRGLRGDRYFDATGTFSSRQGDGREVTLIEQEVIEAVARDYGIEIAPSSTRRNLVTRGIALNHLVGEEFRVGSVQLVGRRLAEPCTHLEKLTQRGVLKAFLHRGGLRADILQGGELRVGDRIEW